MIDTPEIAQSAAQSTAINQLTVPRTEIQKVMGPGIGEVMAAIAAQGVAPAGPWFTRHLRMDPAVFDFEISVPVEKPIVATGRVVPSQLPAATVARTIFHGSYEGLGAAWGEFDAWIKDTLMKADGDRLIEYNRLAPGVQMAHPTREHFVPILVAAGAAAAGNAKATFPIEGFEYGSIARRTVQFG